MRINNRFGQLVGNLETTVNVLGRDMEGIASVSYNSTMAITNHQGGGNEIVGYTLDGETHTCSMDVFLEEDLALSDAIGKGVKLWSIPAFDLPVVYVYQGRTYKDIIKNVKVMGRGREVRVGGRVAVQWMINCTDIIYNAA